MPFADWTPAVRCIGAAQPGARALMRWILEHHDTATNLGIYSCRPVRGGAAMSGHAEGRAGDTGFPMRGGRGSPAGYALVRQLRANGHRLGVQAVIYDRTIWSAKTPGGRPYTGVAPHYDHVHWELTRGAARKLTLATIRHVLEGARPPAHPTLELGDTGPAVRALQRALGRADVGRVTVDGAFGTQTRDAVNRLKRRHRLPPDGVAGPRVWTLLEGGPR